MLVLPTLRSVPFPAPDGVLVALAFAIIGALSVPFPAPAQTVEIVSLSSNEQPGNNISGRFAGPAISGNGQVIAFDSMASNLVPGDTNLEVDVFVHDRATGISERVSVTTAGVQGDDTSTRPAIDETGRFVVFDSAADNLVPGDPSFLDIFLRDRELDTTECMSVSSNEVIGNAGSYDPSITPDGRYVCFISLASNLVASDTNNVEDVFIRDRLLGTTERVNLTHDGQQANSSTTVAAISADARFVAFASFATNLVPDDTNDFIDVFIRDRQTGVTERVSVGDGEEQPNQTSFDPSVSGDGRYVAFYSDATNLVPGDTNDRRDIFVRDRTLGTTERVSVSSSGVQGDGNCQDPAVRGFTASGPQITPDGRFVSFFSSSSNLVPGDTNTCPPVFQSPPGRCPDAFVRDRIAGTTTRVNISSDGVQANDRTADPAISHSGMVVAFFSAAGTLVAGDITPCLPVFPVNCPDIFVRDDTDPTSAETAVTQPRAMLSITAYPNPADDWIDLVIAGADGSPATLVVYDIAGRAVRTLANGRLPSGRVLWDGRDDQGARVANGTYFCRLKAGSRVATEKVTLLKE